MPNPNYRLYPFLSACLFLFTSSVFAQLTSTELDRLIAFDAAISDGFGIAVDVDGDTAVVGARHDDDGGKSSGAAYVYQRDPGTDKWALETKLVMTNAATNDYFGRSVAIQGDVIVVGAPGDDFSTVFPHKGSAHVFTRGSGGWDTGTKLLPGDTLANPAYENYGISVDISGDTIVVGVSFDNESTALGVGSAYVFVKGSSTWTKHARLTPLTADAHQNFGWSVAVEGDTIVVGAPHWTDGGLGETYVFTRVVNWTNAATKLSVNDKLAGDDFGWSVAVSGETIVVGSRYDDDAVKGDHSGSITVFDHSSGAWLEAQKILPSNGAADDQFGNAVATNGDVIFAGSPRSRTNLKKGSVFVYSKPVDSWVEDDILEPAPSVFNISAVKFFGDALAVDGETLIAGAPTSDIYNGSTFIYVAGAAIIYEVVPPPPVVADYGDALYHNFDTYHLVDTSFRLGSLIDTEEAAQANDTATGDDNDGEDDDDGVFFKSAFIMGQTTYIDVIASKPGFLNAWADFGDQWDVASEHIFIDQALVAGTNALSFDVPNTGNVGANAALRFRFSSQQGLGPSGPAADGEVEDYVMVRNAGDGSNSDPDRDGISTATEDAGPNGGDGNNDGIPDSVQLNVTSFPNAADGRYLVLESQPGTFLTNVASRSADFYGTPPTGNLFPYGTLKFNVEGISPGAYAEVNIYLPDNIEIPGYYKYSDHWYEFTWDGNTSTGAITAPGSVTLHLKDGARGDHDLTANGVIEDPGIVSFNDIIFRDDFESE